MGCEDFGGLKVVQVGLQAVTSGDEELRRRKLPSGEWAFSSPLLDSAPFLPCYCGKPAYRCSQFI